MVYIIGVRHDIQFDPVPHRAKIVRDKRTLFKAHVLEVIEALGISILAEEFSDEAKRKWKVSESTLEQLAKAKRIEHRFCDPTSVQKKENGIEESDSDKREQFWLSRIRNCESRARGIHVSVPPHETSSMKGKITAAFFSIEVRI